VSWTLFAWVAGCCCAYIGLCMFLLGVWDRHRKTPRPVPVDMAEPFRINDAFDVIVERYEEARWTAEVAPARAVRVPAQSRVPAPTETTRSSDG
jgi:hypothetical protein